MAERWSEIMHEYGSKTYFPEDYIKAHPIAMNQPVGKNRFGEPITNMTINLDAPAPVITIKEKYAGMDWRDLRRKLPDTVEDDIVSKKNDKGEYIPYVNKATGNKIIVTKKSVDHFKTDHTSNAAATKNRQNTLHYEMIEAIPDIIRKGIWVEAHMDSHGKAEQVIRVLAPVKLNQKIYAVKVTVKRVKNKHVVINGDYTQLTVYDVATKKEPVIDRTSQKSASIETGYLGPKTSITDSNLSISDFLRNVNDNLGKPYIDSDGTPNYGIYFGDNKTGGVMYIGPDKFEQRAWHGSGADFDLGKIRGAFDANSGAIHLFVKVDPLKVTLYDVITEKQSRAVLESSLKSDTLEMTGRGSVDTISIRSMLENVKDYDGNLYVQKTTDNSATDKIKRKKLDIKTMWKKRAEKLHGNYALQDTSETALDATSSTTENVAHNADNVNRERRYDGVNILWEFF